MSREPPKMKWKSLHSPSARKPLFWKVPFVLSFVFSVGLIFYPIGIKALNKMRDEQIVNSYQKQANKAYQADKEKREEIQKEVERKRQLALQDPFSQESLDDARVKTLGREAYVEHTVGVIYAPSIHVSLPIFDETKETFLSKGATWFAISDYPKGGEGRHTVISGHAGSPTATLFKDLKDMKEGDIFVIDTGQQNYLAYKVFRISTVLPDDLSKIQPEKGRDLASLLTCTPYMINSHRLIVTGERVPFTPNTLADIEEELSELETSNHLFVIVIGAVVLGVLALSGVGLLTWMKHRGHYDLVFKVVGEDGESLQALEDVAFTLYDRKGQVEVSRNGEPLVAQVDQEAGVVRLTQLPGYTYTLKALTLPEGYGHLPDLKIFVKKRKDKFFKIKTKKSRDKQKVTLNESDQLTRIGLSRKGGE